jgi:hypothetical protein
MQISKNKHKKFKQKKKIPINCKKEEGQGQCLWRVEAIFLLPVFLEERKQK